MKRILSLAFAAFAGALLLHCGGEGMDALTTDGGSGFVEDARGQPSGQCCAPPAQQFTVIAQVELGADTLFADFDVSGYREVIIYTITSTPFNGCGHVEVAFRANADAPYGMTGVASIPLFRNGLNPPAGGGRIRVDGTDMRLTGFNDCDGIPRTIVVAGVTESA